MPLAPTEFGAALAREVQAGRSFGRHPLWCRIEEGGLGPEALRGFATQFFLQVVEFPRAISALHARCPDRGERAKLAASLYEEETGSISGTKAHPELFLDFCAALGLARHDVLAASPLPSTAALVQWFEECTQRLSFLEGVAAINLAAEGQVAGAFGPFARALVERYGLPGPAVAFWVVHEQADREHSEVGDHIVTRLANTDEVQERVLAAVRTSLGMWWRFFDGIERRFLRPAAGS
jgi:pyrroloquinoline-quinone synthase